MSTGMPGLRTASLPVREALLWIGLVPGITVGSIFFVVGFVILLVGVVTPEEAG